MIFLFNGTEILAFPFGYEEEMKVSYMTTAEWIGHK